MPVELDLAFDSVFLLTALPSILFPDTGQKFSVLCIILLHRNSTEVENGPMDSSFVYLFIHTVLRRTSRPNQ